MSAQYIVFGSRTHILRDGPEPAPRPDMTDVRTLCGHWLFPDDMDHIDTEPVMRVCLNCERAARAALGDSDG